MPQMSGTELATRVRFFRKGLKVLHISGYADDTAVHTLELAHGEAFLQKPMTPAVLARKVRALLDEK